ncbi:MAG: hypothetical protein MUE94_09495 [Verrucomicrobia bacterium]|nr:hypothetical protein [Verrucomicrobiota bacterium]
MTAAAAGRFKAMEPVPPSKTSGRTGGRVRPAIPQVPTFAVSATLFLGALLRKPSFLQLQYESARRGWQRLIGHGAALTDDRMVYVCERYRLEDWRAMLVSINQTLKRNKAFETAKIHGLLVVALDANEQFKSRCRWLVSQDLEGIPAQGLWRMGHWRWGIENHVFNELTQHYHLEHCPHHEPAAITAWRRQKNHSPCGSPRF